MFLSPTDENKIIETINNMTKNKCGNIDGLSTKIL